MRIAQIAPPFETVPPTRFDMAQFLVQAKREGQPLWRTFWVGGTLRGYEPEPGRPPPGADTRSPAWGSPSPRMAPSMVWGVTLPWSLVASLALGLWLMAAPDLLGGSGASADSDRVFGALVAVVAVIAWAEVSRAARFASIPLALWIVLSPLMLAGATTASLANNVARGLALIALSLPRGPIRERFGLFQGWVR